MMDLGTVKQDGAQAVEDDGTIDGLIRNLEAKVQALEQEKILLYRALMELAQAAEVIGNHAQRIVASLGIKVNQL